jgi:acetoin utilization protein AcuB
MGLRRVPRVSDCMTSSPISVGPEEKLSRAKRLMEERVVRHLPVVRGRDLVGILSYRDVCVVELMERLANVPLEEITVGDAMIAEPFAVSPETPLDVVAREMAGRRVGSAVVVDEGTIRGVFTTSDALRALALVLGGEDLSMLGAQGLSAP